MTNFIGFVLRPFPTDILAGAAYILTSDRVHPLDVPFSQGDQDDVTVGIGMEGPPVAMNMNGHLEIKLK